MERLRFSLGAVKMRGSTRHLWNKYGTRKKKRVQRKSPEPLKLLERKTGFGPATPTLARG
jgi:hypothetical protein